MKKIRNVILDLGYVSTGVGSHGTVYVHDTLVMNTNDGERPARISVGGTPSDRNVFKVMVRDLRKHYDPATGNFPNENLAFIS